MGGSTKPFYRINMYSRIFMIDAYYIITSMAINVCVYRNTKHNTIVKKQTNTIMGSLYKIIFSAYGTKLIGSYWNI